jgi:hypothetical protein
MQERNAILERDVERYNERRAIEHQVCPLILLAMPLLPTYPFNVDRTTPDSHPRAAVPRSQSSVPREKSRATSASRESRSTS